MFHQTTRLGGPLRAASAVLVAICCLAATPGAFGQDDDGPIYIPERSERIGFNGYYRDGVWTPVVVQVNNRAEQIGRGAECEVLLNDIDGDKVQARRSFVLKPVSDGPTSVRVYIVPPVNSPRKVEWDIRIVDAETRELLATRKVIPADTARNLLQSQSAIGVVGRGLPPMGLNLFSAEFTQHEHIEIVKDLDAADLPDRWYAYSLFEALIWSPKAGDPTAPAIKPQMDAIREWVRRGGHLVVILPSVGSYWSSPAVADLVPPVRIEPVRDIPPPPALLPTTGLPGRLQAPLDDIRTPAHTFSPLGGDSELSVLSRTADGEPIVVAHTFGFGRVTLIGVDLTDPVLLAPGLPISNDPQLKADLNALSMPAPESALWRQVFGWASPGLSSNRLLDLQDGKYTPPGWNPPNQAVKKNPRLSDPRTRERYDLSKIVDGPLSMKGTAVGALLVAFFLFAIYWVVAGPVSFAVLKSMRRSQHSWAAFGLIVILFSAVAWGGAYLIRPTDTQIQHFTVLDADAQSGLVHTHSWMTLFVATHGQVDVSVGDAPQADATQSDAARARINTITSAGILYSAADPTFFPDQRRYTIDAARPDNVSLPMRSTAKQLEVDYMGPPAGAADANPRAWKFFTGKVTYANNTLTGTLTSNLPAPLEDVLFVFCPGDGQTPYVWQQSGAWQPGQPIPASPPPNRPILAQNTPLAVQPRDFYNQRRLTGEGFLGELILNKGAIGNPAITGGPVVVSSDDIVRHTQLLTFYGLLPPPDFIERDGNFMVGTRAGEAHLTRKAGRPFDMTELTAMRRLIIIGHLKTRREDNVPLPTPLLIDGREVPSSGHTVVRWVTTVEGE
jgi:hypothetical protein